MAAFFRLGHGLARGFRDHHSLHARVTNSRHWWDIKGNPSWWRTDAKARLPITDGGTAMRSRWAFIFTATIRCGCRRPCCTNKKAAFWSRRSSRGQPSRPERLHFNKGLAGGRPKRSPREILRPIRRCRRFRAGHSRHGRSSRYPGTARSHDQNRARRRRRHDRATAILRKIAPEPGSYVSESNYFNRNWQAEYWGANHAAWLPDQGEIRSRRAFHRASRRGQRSLER